MALFLHRISSLSILEFLLIWLVLIHVCHILLKWRRSIFLRLPVLIDDVGLSSVLVKAFLLNLFSLRYLFIDRPRVDGINFSSGGNHLPNTPPDRYLILFLRFLLRFYFLPSSVLRLNLFGIDQILLKRNRSFLSLQTWFFRFKYSVNRHD